MNTRMSTRWSRIVAIAIVLVMAMAATAYARPATIPADQIDKGVFIDPTRGNARPGTGGGTGEYNATYKYKGIRWQSPFVHYKVDTSGSSLDAPAADAAVAFSFWAWETANNNIGRADQSYVYFVDDGGAAVSGPKLDNVNVVSWAPLGSGTLAATYYWYDRRTKYLIETDIVFNNTLSWSTSGEAGKYDVANIGTHEVGHTLQLGDLYTAPTSDLTMYGYGSTGETKKQTLGLGDMLGAEKAYPGP